MLLFFWLSFLCFIAIGNNICGQNNGGCEQLCLPSPQSTIQCACADGFQLENDGKICLDIGKYFVIQTSQCVCFHVVLCDIYILNIQIVCDTRPCITPVCHKCFFVISESDLKCQLFWVLRCSPKMKYEEQIILRNVENLY
jgi:hypothetical protein